MLILGNIFLYSTPAYSAVVQSALHSAIVSTELPWTTWKRNKHLLVEYRPTTNQSLIEINAKVTVTSSMSGFLLFIQDTQHIDKWLNNAKSSKVLKQTTAQKNTFITQFNNFWPITPRYMVVTSHYWQNPDKTLEIAVEDNNEKNYLLKNQIKVEVIKAHWLITPVKENSLIIEYNFIADPKGKLPFWLVKRVQLNSIWETMKALKKQLPESVWQLQKLPHINELDN